MFGEDQHVEQVACSTVRSLAVVTGVSVELLGQVLRHVDQRHCGSWHAGEVEKTSQLHDLDGPGGPRVTSSWSRSNSRPSRRAMTL